MQLNESDIQSLKAKLTQQCAVKDVVPAGIDVMGLGDYYIYCATELDMYRVWDMYLHAATKGYSENLKTWYVHIQVNS